jgi:hypothetical protein
MFLRILFIGSQRKKIEGSITGINIVNDKDIIMSLPDLSPASQTRINS